MSASGARVGKQAAMNIEFTISLISCSRIAWLLEIETRMLYNNFGILVYSIKFE